MKNGKAPTREQKKMMKAHGLVPENWLVVKNLPDSLEVVRPDAFQVSSRRSNRSSRIYGSMRTLPETKEPVRCCMRS